MFLSYGFRYCRNPHTAKQKWHNICGGGTVDFVQVGKRVKIRRHVLGLTQEELAERLGVCTSYIGHIERGSRKMSVETLYALCKALDTSADFLIGIY